MNLQWTNLPPEAHRIADEKHFVKNFLSVRGCVTTRITSDLPDLPISPHQQRSKIPIKQTQPPSNPSSFQPFKTIKHIDSSQGQKPLVLAKRETKGTSDHGIVFPLHNGTGPPANRTTPPSWRGNFRTFGVPQRQLH
jgi:hypothetical protein